MFKVAKEMWSLINTASLVPPPGISWNPPGILLESKITDNSATLFQHLEFIFFCSPGKE